MGLVPEHTFIFSLYYLLRSGGNPQLTSKDSFLVLFLLFGVFFGCFLCFFVFFNIFIGV